MDKALDNIAQLRYVIASHHSIIGTALQSHKQQILNLLKQRFEKSKKSFVILYQNNCKTEANIIAGYMLELLATIFNIEKQNDTIVDKIIGYAYYEQVRMYSKIPRKYNPDQWDEILNMCVDLVILCANSIFEDPTSAIDILHNNKMPLKQKLKQLNKSVKKDAVQSKIDSFISEASNIAKKIEKNEINIKWIFKQFYISYCCFKHNNFLSFLLDENNAVPLVTLLSIIAYYKDFGEVETLEEKYKKEFETYSPQRR